ncbi:uncharacterized protein LOC120131792 [Hibiscus syriacus]|uniref:uncharacterized protein LOC120131792 n=1 Tax=Hibiscus syriacus TaxID=106335 RepID=UPI001921AA4D|nr:uncharacterized protein LOC120131792 [Hibiscus syriacus]
MNLKITFILAVLLSTTSLSAVARHDSFEASSSEKNNDNGDRSFYRRPEFGDHGRIEGMFDPGFEIVEQNFESGGGDTELGWPGTENWRKDRIMADTDGSWFRDPSGGEYGSWAGGFNGGYDLNSESWARGFSGGYDFNGGSVVCNQKGPCYKKKLTCPAKCYTSVTKSGKGFHASASGGGCTMDCEKTCKAFC